MAAKRRADRHYCELITIGLLLPRDAFSLKDFSDELGTGIGIESNEATTITGPLRQGIRSESYGISARIEYHEHPDENHYWIVIRASKRDAKMKVQKEWPTVRHFQEAVLHASSTKPLRLRVTARHTFPKKSWRGMLELPVPLPSRSGATRVDLTGVQVSFETKDGREIVLVTSKDDSLTAATEFELTIDEGSSEMLTTALARSVSVAKKFLDEVVSEREND